MPTIVINKKGSTEPIVKSSAENPVTIGRLPNNTVQLKSAGVSRTHAKIILDGENFFLIDAGSGNGTFLNGLSLKANDKNLLRAGDIIAIDDFQLHFHPEDALAFRPTGEDVTESDILEVKLLKKVLSAMDKETVPNIQVLNGSCEGKKFLFTDDITEIVLGRDPDCDFPINEYVVSRRHVKIAKRWGGIAIRDLESKNGTFLNNRKIVEEYLHDGDRIALGTIVLIFRNPQEINFANIEDIKPKHRPAQISPDDIPGVEGESEVQPEENAEGQEAEEVAEEEQSAVEQWDKLENERAEENYPRPEPNHEKIKTLTPLEIGMIGLGAVVFIFALITLINLMSS